MKKDTAMFVNMSIMMYLWMATSVSYYTLNFYLKYLEGNMFNNSNIAALAECFSLFMAGGIYLKFGLQWALLISFGIALVGAVLIIMFEAVYVSMVPIFVLFAKFGIGAAFGLNYLANFIFPVKYAS